MRRRSVPIQERMSMCFLCSHPISQRHHMLPVSRYGDSTNTMALCANCHEAFHIFARAYEDILANKEHSRNIALMLKLRFHWQRNPRLADLCMYVRQAHNQQHGITSPVGDRIWEDFFDAHDRRMKEGW